MFAFLLESLCFLQLLQPVDFVASSLTRPVDEKSDACLEEKADPAGDLAELLSMIQRTSPGLYRRICRMPRQALLEAFMTAAGCSVSAERSEDGRSDAAERKIEVFHGRLLEQKRVFYLRLDGLTQETLSGARDELLQSLVSSPSAMVLDLRNAGCGDSDDEFAHVQKFFDLLKKDPEIAAWYGTHPLAVLISGKTSGAAALLALLLSRDESKALTVGSPTSGSCFPARSVSACGIRWQVPRIPDELADPEIPTGPLAPVFPVAGKSGQIDFRKLADPQAISADSVLRTSLDLVLSLSVLKPGKAAE